MEKYVLNVPTYLFGLIAYFFLLLNNIPFYAYTTVYTLIHLLKDTMVVSSLGQVYKKLL